MKNRIAESFRYCLKAVTRSIAKMVLANSKKNFKVISYGSKYGSWKIAEIPESKVSTLISAGLGEDASFEIEVARKYGWRVIFVDPTPRAIQHFTSILSRIGKQSESSLASDGRQDPRSYNLTEIDFKQLSLEASALYETNDFVVMRPPLEPSHVSYRISNVESQVFKFDGPNLVAKSVTLDTIISKHSVTGNFVLKMDIEGVEEDVFRDIFSKKIYPTQILFESEDLSNPSALSIFKFLIVHRMLHREGYFLQGIQSPGNLTYCRNL